MPSARDALGAGDLLHEAAVELQLLREELLARRAVLQHVPYPPRLLGRSIRSFHLAAQPVRQSDALIRPRRLGVVVHGGSKRIPRQRVEVERIGVALLRQLRRGLGRGLVLLTHHHVQRGERDARLAVGQLEGLAPIPRLAHQRERLLEERLRLMVLLSGLFKFCQSEEGLSDAFLATQLLPQRERFQQQLLTQLCFARAVKNTRQRLAHIDVRASGSPR
mmetsp:Transcript_16258/g.39003  ORF Transcript_16258/g.39003 Transcript_16258/m.39003 type:complete len:220 (-) Transcript_16258:46-705(-)